MTERPDDLSFASPGPGAPGPGAPGPGAPGPGVPGPGVPGVDPATGPAGTASGSTASGSTAYPGAAAAAPVPPSQVPYGDRWGAPDGPTPAERAAARRRARIWVAGTLGLIVVVVGLAAGVSAAVSGAHERAWAPVPADVDAPRDVNAVQLVLGSCVADLPASDVVTSVEVVPCADPHAAQVVGRTDAAPDAVWPGDDVAARRAATNCSADLLGSQARQAADSWSFVVWAPTEESWQDGDRAGLCLAVGSEKATGNLLE
ncbi:septum formation family protein [Isoptericola jiangsuensis]|uniref:septum formation family protein n=1 Tax=Isoptericola jiangsuensis TaxID=548579 RepID=UPI003AAAE8AF